LSEEKESNFLVSVPETLPHTPDVYCSPEEI